MIQLATSECTDMIPFEEENVQAYRLVLRIEVALRECLRSSLEGQFGARWRKMLPGDLHKKIKDAQSEANRPQFDHLNLGPLYYLTLGELLPILQQKAGQPTANRFGGECFVKQLENILGPRNSLCHSRCVSTAGLRTIQAVYSQMESALTTDGFERLLSEPDVGLSPSATATHLLPWLRKSLIELSNLTSIVIVPDKLELAMSQFWWGEESLAGFDCITVQAAIDLVREYISLPHGIGSAGIRQQFCERRNPEAVIQQAIVELERVSS